MTQCANGRSQFICEYRQKGTSKIVRGGGCPLQAKGVQSLFGRPRGRSPSLRRRPAKHPRLPHGRPWEWLQQAYGNTEVRTPNLKRIASRGVRMANAYTPCPVCSPARPVFSPAGCRHKHGIHDWIEEKTRAYAVPWLKGQTLLSELLRGAGYHTGLVGKWHCGEERTHTRDLTTGLAIGFAISPPGETEFLRERQHVEADGFQSPLLTERAINFLRNHHRNQRRAQRPFFLFVGYTDTHSPHKDMPEDLVALYNQATFRDIPNEVFARCHGKPTSPVSDNPSVERASGSNTMPQDPLLIGKLARYWTKLESSGQLANTLVVTQVIMG